MKKIYTLEKSIRKNELNRLRLSLKRKDEKIDELQEELKIVYREISHFNSSLHYVVRVRKILDDLILLKYEKQSYEFPNYEYRCGYFKAINHIKRNIYKNIGSVKLNLNHKIYVLNKKIENDTEYSKEIKEMLWFERKNYK